MSVRVAVDATALPANRVGAGVSIVELLRALPGPGLEVHVLVNRRDEEELRAYLPSVTVHPVKVGPRPARLLWGHAGLSRKVRSLAPDVFWGPHYTVPRGLGCPAVVSFHDPTFFTLPSLHERSKVVYFQRAARHGIARAARVVTPSDYARRGAIEHAGADPERVEVVAHGVDHERYRPSDGGRGDGRPYILFVGTLEPRKDVPSLVAAYERLARDGLPHDLVLAGPPAWGAAAVESALSRVEHGTVRRTGFVSEDEKIALYQQASLFVYPSVAEGFGLPVLEAMACGAPAITTKGSATEEVAGDGAMLVAPSDPAGLSEAMDSVLTDETLAADLRRRGTKRAASFTWQAAAESMTAVWTRAARAGEPAA